MYQEPRADVRGRGIVLEKLYHDQIRAFARDVFPLAGNSSSLRRNILDEAYALEWEAAFREYE